MASRKRQSVVGYAGVYFVEALRAADDAEQLDVLAAGLFEDIDRAGRRAAGRGHRAGEA